MILFVGLGNPGKQYRETRHNIGFMAVDAIMRRHEFSAPRTQFGGELSDGRLDHQKILVFKPMTFMNLSGQALGELARYFDVAAKDIVVFYDEIALPLGKTRLRVGGSAGGHNGMRSCIAHIGEGFRRVRLGIGHPGNKEMVGHHVLGGFSKDEMNTIITPWLAHISDEAILLAQNRDDLFANRIHLAMEEVLKGEA